MSALMELASRVESATPNDRTGLNAEVAKAVGWQRITPSQMGRGKQGGWISPDDYLGRYSDGRPKLDSLHGTDIHLDPPAFLNSLDSALTLVPEGWNWMAGNRNQPTARAYVENGELAFVGVGMQRNPDQLWFETTAATPALALTAACLRARASMEGAGQ